MYLKSSQNLLVREVDFVLNVIAIVYSAHQQRICHEFGNAVVDVIYQ
jgi:hypothetical protein